jgi:tetratricopeptide (TPR) repeat protein
MVNPGQERYIQLLTAADPKPLEERTKQIEDALNSSDPREKNNVAYTLANGKSHLADAQTLAEQAVQMEEQTASKMVAMDKKVASFEQMGILGDVWETLGWVYYQQGHAEKAEPYMHAAWQLKPRNVEINLSLGLIDEALNKPGDATICYRMALSGNNTTNIQSLIQKRLNHLGVTMTDPLPMETTTPLPSFAVQVSASDGPQVDILLSHEKPPVVSVLKGDKALEKPLAEAIRADRVNSFPDFGPEKVLRRARVTCAAGDKPVCELHFLGSQVAMDASAQAK